MRHRPAAPARDRIPAPLACSSRFSGQSLARLSSVRVMQRERNDGDGHQEAFEAVALEPTRRAVEAAPAASRAISKQGSAGP